MAEQTNKPKKKGKKKEKEGEEEEQPREKRNYRRDKPWDTPDIDKWKPVSWNPEDMKHRLLEESSFATLFPKYREKYIREVWPQVTRALAHFGIEAVLDLVEGTMSVKTTRKTWDPYCIFKARDLIKLLARSVPFPQAVKILDDEVHCDIVKLKGLVGTKEKFVKRRQRLLGPNSATLKAIELLTNCYVLVQGNTVSAIGPIKGLKQVRDIVEECMFNVHPVYNIKALMIKRELAKDPELQTESWDRFLPQFKKKQAPKKKKPKIKKKEFNPFPPEQTPRKIDLEIESGEYFLSEAAKKKRAKKEKEASNKAKKLEKEQKKAQDYVAPKEPKIKEVSTEEKRSVSALRDDLLKKTEKKRKTRDKTSTEPKKKKRKVDE
eukprot:CAMPEP_0201492758 /NCGR_PEP_ID=MMETSP0151_2-20130828/34660_1 /ASSEMBLY_ACC=CAM_ASM_000257 /TAXON_ID=200890 /ORGANISM="Paramoeba atlantica, Strain 621/1 / CCAP 1560/9" /LENGTH=377 /DNA_ID=CAMNT_0047879767 /DNA_START=74 /DNA_END=1207 /DNA_ORIENTATION=+